MRGNRRAFLFLCKFLRVKCQKRAKNLSKIHIACKCVSGMDMLGLQLYERIWKEHSRVLFNNIRIVRPIWMDVGASNQ